jgi:predicted phosphodiesterase
MLFGNHDIARRDPSIVKKSLYRYMNGEDNQQKALFDGIRVHEGLVLKDHDTGREIFVVHGHQGDFMNDTLGWISQFLLRKLRHPLQLYGFQDPTRAATNNTMRIKVEEKLIDWIVENQQPTLCGHTHHPNLPLNGGPPYFNTGSCVHPRWITGIEIINHEIMLVRWMVHSDKLGVLRIERNILAGPRKLGHFF